MSRKVAQPTSRSAANGILPASLNSPSMPAKAGIHAWRKNELAQTTITALQEERQDISAHDTNVGNALNSPSMPAEAGIHVWRKNELALSPNPNTILPKKGNPTIVIPPLMFDPSIHTGWVYIMANRPNGTLYVGQTSNLPQRAYQHQQGKIPGFSQKHGCKLLVYFEGYQLITTSIERENVLKNWPRSWKIRRIMAVNPHWQDLSTELTV